MVLADAAMSLTYFKRYRMEFDLAGDIAPPPALPAGYVFEAWKPSLIEEHASVKHQSFQFEIDSTVFPCFAKLKGCRRLMQEIVVRDGFLPAATWLMAYEIEEPGGMRTKEYCGTIQGICDRNGLGSVQNIGVCPLHRGRRIGANLIYKALQGFRSAGLERATLEVTAQNTGALRLYERLGWRTVKTVYKATEVAYV